MGRKPASLVIVSALVILASTALAGGNWLLHDDGLGLEVKFNGARVVAGKDAASQEEALVFDHGQAMVTRSRYHGLDGDIQFEIREDAIVHHGVTVAEIEGDSLRFPSVEGAAFEVAWKASKRKRFRRPVWELTVKRGEETIASGRAIHLIDKARRITRAMQKRDILNRVRLYLAWRILLADKEKVKAEAADASKADEIAIASTMQHCWQRLHRTDARFNLGGQLTAEWKANPKGQLLHIAFTKNPFDFSPEFNRCVQVRSRQYDVKWAPSGKPEITLEPIPSK